MTGVIRFPVFLTDAVAEGNSPTRAQACPVRRQPPEFRHKDHDVHAFVCRCALPVRSRSCAHLESTRRAEPQTEQSELWTIKLSECRRRSPFLPLSFRRPASGGRQGVRFVRESRFSYGRLFSGQRPTTERCRSLIRKNQRNHGLSDGNRPNSDTRIMTSTRLYVDLLSLLVRTLLRAPNRRGGQNPKPNNRSSGQSSFPNAVDGLLSCLSLSDDRLPEVDRVCGLYESRAFPTEGFFQASVRPRSGAAA